MITIYRHIHIASGRIYVGQTRLSMEKRWKSHVYDAVRGASGSRVFAAAIREFGPEAFAHEVLEVCDSQRNANDAELKWITHFACCAPYGFNLKLGASGGKGDVHPETCALIRDAATKRWSEYTPERRAEIAANIAGAKVAAFQALPEDVKRTRSAQGAAQLAAVRNDPDAHAYLQWCARQGVAAMTVEQREDVARRARDSWTPERRAEWSNAAKVRHAAESSDVRAERYDRVGASVRDWHAAKTPDERREFSNKIRAGQMRRSPEDRTARARKASDAARARSPEERKASARRSAATRRVRVVESFVVKLDAMPEPDRLAMLSLVPVQFA